MYLAVVIHKIMVSLWMVNSKSEHRIFTVVEIYDTRVV